MKPLSPNVCLYWTRINTDVSYWICTVRERVMRTRCTHIMMYVPILANVVLYVQRQVRLIDLEQGAPNFGPRAGYGDSSILPLQEEQCFIFCWENHERPELQLSGVFASSCFQGLLSQQDPCWHSVRGQLTAKTPGSCSFVASPGEREALFIPGKFSPQQLSPIWRSLTQRKQGKFDYSCGQLILLVASRKRWHFVFLATTKNNPTPFKSQARSSTD